MMRTEDMPRCIVLFMLMATTAGCTTLKQWDYEGFSRDEWQRPEQVIRSLQIGEGEYVADLGSGSGYFTFRLGEAVSPAGKVYAVDIDEKMNQLVASRAEKEGAENVEVILARYDDPLLPESGVDLIFTCNTYHHIEERAIYFAKTRQYLHPEGRIAIIDYNGAGWLERLLGHWVEREQVEEEMKKAGYQLDHEFHFLKKQHFLVFSAEEQ